MEFNRIFYRNGTHDEIPVDDVVEDGDVLVFMARATELLRVPRDDIVTIEDR
jgi:hypothetical protein